MEAGMPLVEDQRSAVGEAWVSMAFHVDCFREAVSGRDSWIMVAWVRAVGREVAMLMAEIRAEGVGVEAWERYLGR